MKTWRFLGRLIAYKPGVYLLNILNILVTSAIPLGMGLIIRRVLDLLSQESRLPPSGWLLIALMVVAAGVASANLIAGEAINILLRMGVSSLLRLNTLAQILARPGAEPLPVSPGAAIGRFRDDVKLLEHAVSNSLNPLEQGSFTIVGLAIMARINLPITLAVFGPLFLTLLIVNAAGRRIERLRQDRQETLSRVTGFLGEVFAGVQSIKLAGAEEHVSARFRRFNEARGAAAVRDSLLETLLGSISWSMAGLGTGLILLFAGRAMRAGDFSVGDFALFVYYLEIMTQTTGFLGMFWARYKASAVSIERLNSLSPGARPEMLVAHNPVHLRGHLPEATVTIRPVSGRLQRLELKGLTLSNGPGEEGGRMAIRDVNLQIAGGTLTVITGRVGSGKSTLLRAMLGLLPVEKGEIYWNGRRVADPAAFFAPPRCAFTPQTPSLFSTTLRENILLGLSEAQVDLQWAVEMAVLEEDLARLEHGLDTPVGPRGVRLSGGQVHRTAAARMFVRRPQLLVFDDLSSALDGDTERILWQRLDSWRRSPGGDRPTLLAVSHRPAALRRADKIVLMKDGAIESVGPLEELLAHSPEMGRLWRAYGEEG